MTKKSAEESMYSPLIAKSPLTVPYRAVKMNLANEGLEARKKDEEVATKKRKAEEDTRWEGKFHY